MKILTIFLALLFFSQTGLDAQSKQRFIAITIDDLPVVSTRNDLKTRQEITRKLLKNITEAKVPVIGFVNEIKLYANDKRDEQEVDLLRQWLGAGLDLGNHTFSHLSLDDNPLEKYEDEILRGEMITKELLKTKNKQMTYFRHPYLQTGQSLEIKSQLNQFFAQHNYKIAPVTIEDADWIFAQAYDNADEKNDRDLMKKLGAAYIRYFDAKIDYAERQSNRLFEREIKEIMLLHANSINADYFGDLARTLKKRGYRFVTLEDALRDEAYKLPDTLVGRGGMTWLYRWAAAKGKEYVLPDEPKMPDFVTKTANGESK